jgi:predicted metal-dependent hydrolase
MNLAEEAFAELFPEKDISEYELRTNYNGRFKPYNANVRYCGNKIQFNLSKKWKTISREIQIGLMQELLLKIFRVKKKTTNIDLYNIFMRNVHIAVPKTKADPVLEKSFDRVNEKYFYGLIEKPNLAWGNASLRKLGSYEYGTDTITISRILYGNERLLDYVMYHEILHKKHKFRNKNGRNYHHTSEFRKEEREFEGSKEIEKQLKRVISKKRLKMLFKF